MQYTGASAGFRHTDTAMMPHPPPTKHFPSAPPLQSSSTTYRTTIQLNTTANDEDCAQQTVRIASTSASAAIDLKIASTAQRRPLRSCQC